jgi:hypothetical protein
MGHAIPLGTSYRQFIVYVTTYFSISEVYGVRCQVSVFSPAAGRIAASQFEKETLKKRITNIEQEIMNPPPADKCRSKVFYRFILIRNSQSEAIPHFIIRYFLFDILRFAFIVSYERRRWPPASSQIEKETTIDA